MFATQLNVLALRWPMAVAQRIVPSLLTHVARARGYHGIYLGTPLPSRSLTRNLKGQYLNRYLFGHSADPTTSGSLHSEPSRRRRPRRLWQAIIGLSILIVALAVFAWQQGGDGDSDGPLNAIAAAAERTQHEPGGRATMETVVSSPVRSESFTITSQMVFDAETGRSRAVMTVPHPESDGSVEMQIVGDGTVMYMRSSLFGSLPGGREWMALDLSFGQELGMPVPANGDAKGELELLEAVTGDVQKLGKEDVRGVPRRRATGARSVSPRVPSGCGRKARRISPRISRRRARLCRSSARE